MHKTFAAVALIALPIIPVAAQTATQIQPAQSPLSFNFEVASVKPASAQALGGSFEGGPGTDDPGRFTVRNYSLRQILSIAFGIKDNALSGPAWLDQVKFDILAKVPAGATRDQLKIMLQNLLMERFRLAVHRTTTDVAGYALVIGKSGVKLKALAESDIPPLPKLEDLAKAGGNQKSVLDDDGFPHLSPLYRIGISRIEDRGRLAARGATVAEMIPGIQR